MNHRPEVIVHAIGSMPSDFVAVLRSAIERHFNVLTVEGPNWPIPLAAYDPARSQYQASVLLESLVARASRDGKVHLGVTPVDLFSDRLQFVFGAALPEADVAVFSVARLNPEYYGGRPDAMLVLRRSVTEAVHELGHVFGLKHCEKPDCVMWFSNTLAETDRKGSDFCRDHFYQLAHRRKSA